MPVTLCLAAAPAVRDMTSQGSAYGRFRRAIQRRHVVAAEIAANEMGQLSLIDALTLVAGLRTHR